MENEQSKNQLNGVSYTRISTLGQVNDERGIRREDASPEAHKARCTQHMAYKSNSNLNGVKYNITEHIVDEGFSGKDTNRPGFQKLWRLIAEEKIKFVVTPELSRFSRSVMDFLDFMAHCEKNSVLVNVIGQDIDTSTATGKMVVTILMAVAQAEREITAMRVRENVLARLIKNGKINGSAAILGIKRDINRKGHFVIDPAGVSILRKVLNTYLEEPSKKITLKKLKSDGVTNPDGSEITSSQIDTIIRNTKYRYRGLWEANCANKDADQDYLSEFQKYQLVKLDHGPVLELELLNAVVQKLETTKTENKKSGTNDYVYLLSGCLFSQDGTKFAGEGAKGGLHRYYYNRSNGARIRCDDFDAFILETIKKQFFEDDKFMTMVRSAIRARQSMLPAVENELKQLYTELSEINKYEKNLRDRLKQSVLGGSDKFDELLMDEVTKNKTKQELTQSALEKLKKSVEELRVNTGLEDLQAQVKKVIISGFGGMTMTQRRSVVERIIKRIVISDGNRLEIEFYTEGRSYRVPLKAPSVTREEESSESQVNGGSDETRTRGLLRDRQTL